MVPRGGIEASIQDIELEHIIENRSAVGTAKNTVMRICFAGLIPKILVRRDLMII